MTPIIGVLRAFSFRSALLARVCSLPTSVTDARPASLALQPRAVLVPTRLNRIRRCSSSGMDHDTSAAVTALHGSRMQAAIFVTGGGFQVLRDRRTGWKTHYQFLVVSWQQTWPVKASGESSNWK